MTSVSNERISTNLPILDAKNYDNRCKQMKVVFGYQDVLEVVKNEVTTLVEGAIYAQRSKHNEEKTKDYKVLFFVHECVDADNFEKVGDCESSKQTWEILEKVNLWDDKEKVVRLQTHKRQLELIQMEENETINNFTTRITWFVNQVNARRETILQCGGCD